MTRRLHHLGVACRDLESDTRALRALGYALEGDDFVDRLQGVRGRFLTGPGPRIELLVELADAAVLRPWLAQGVKIYHQAYEVDDLAAEIREMEQAGALMVRPPVPATAFGDRRICFLALRNTMLVELIEGSAPA